MPTKLITSLDQLEPGMKTKDGWELLSDIDHGYYRVKLTRTDGEEITYPMMPPVDVLSIFLNQEVEVPE